MAKSDPHASFNSAVAFVLAHEGGYTNDPADPGGETIFGISRRAHPEAWASGPPSIEDARGIYHRVYWEPLSCPELPWPLALVLFDAAVNCGKHGAVQMLQKALNDFESAGRPLLAVDGILGPRTKASVLAKQAGIVARRLIHHRQGHYVHLARHAGGKKFLRGWFRRTLDLADAIWQLSAQRAASKRQPALAWRYMP